MNRLTERRIGIDARFYGPQGKGLGRYTERLISHLEKIPAPFRFVVFLQPENWSAYHPTSPRFSKVLAPFQWYTVSEQIKFPALIKRQKLDLMHFAHFNVPLFTPGRFVVTIHDLILTKFPTERATTLGPFLYRIKHAASQIVLRQAVRRAAKVITVSDYSADDIISTLGVSRDKISVVLEGCETLAGDKQVHPPIIGEGLPDKYLMYAGNAYPHKNVEKLIEAWQLLRDRGRSESLVLVGRMDYFYQRIRQEVRRRNLDRGPVRIIFTGHVSDGELRWLYQHAAVYVFPSRIEGFGLPALEAMLEGSPVVAARASCLPEILGESALYFNPEEKEDIARCILSVLNDPELAAGLVHRGRSHAQLYSWTRTAEKTMAVYQNLL